MKLIQNLSFHRPKILIESGNIILESKIDKNITFRTQGRGAINMMTNLGYYSLSHQMIGTNTDMMSRLDSVEASVSNNRLIMDRLETLEQRMQEIAVMIISTLI